MAAGRRWEGLCPGRRAVTQEGEVPSSPGPLAPHRPPREVVGAKEKSKRKFPPAALPAEFGAFFAGQAPPLSDWPRPALLGPAPKPDRLPAVSYPLTLDRTRLALSGGEGEREGGALTI